MIAYINVRCNQWAKWRSMREDLGIGYPHCSPFTKPPGGGPATANLAINEAEFEIEMAIRGLDEELQGIIFLFYIGRGDMTEKAERCGFSQVTFYAKLHQAHTRIMEWLNDAAAGLHNLNRPVEPYRGLDARVGPQVCEVE